MPDLKEIALTIDKGFVIRENKKPVKILGGLTGLAVNTLNKEEFITKNIIDGITRVHAEIIPKGVNGYIINGKHSEGFKSSDHQSGWIFYAALVYEEK